MREGEVMVTTAASAAPTPAPRGDGRPPGKKDGYPLEIYDGAVASGEQDQAGDLVWIGSIRGQNRLPQ
jgi:hypothetical protein